MPTETDAQNVQDFNLYLAGNVINELTAFLNKTAQQCGHRYELLLSHLLQTDVEVITAVEVEQLALNAETDQRYFRNWVVVNDDSHALAVVAVDRNISGVCLDLVCGGQGELVSRDHEKEITPGELRVVYKVVGELFKCFIDAFHVDTLSRLDFPTKTQEMEAQRHTTAERDFVACMHFIICIGNYSGDIVLMFPAPVIASMSNLRQRRQYRIMEKALRQRLTRVPLPLTAILGRQHTTLSRAMSLKPGDIIPLSQPLDADVFIGKKYFGKAEVTAENGRLSLQINKPVPVKAY